MIDSEGLRAAHHVGDYFHAYSRDDVMRTWICCAYDPRVDYFCATVDDLGPPRMTDISVRAIGRTWHERWDREKFPAPQLLVDATRAAKDGVPWTVPGGVSDADVDILVMVHRGAVEYWQRVAASRSRNV